MLNLIEGTTRLIVRCLERVRRASVDETGSSTVETVIIVAAAALMAIGAMAAIAAAVDGKVAGIQL